MFVSLSIFERLAKMKKCIRLTKNSLIALYIVFAVLGSVVAAFTYFRYTYIARGIVGAATLYLFFKHDQFHMQDGPIEELLLHPNKIKDLTIVFIAAIILTWAGMQLLDVYLFFIRK